jgi:chemotaxis protein MotB
MKSTIYLFLASALLSSLLLSGCVSNKKHKEIISNLKNNYQSELDAQSESYSTQLSDARTNIRNLELNLAERKGENNILIMLRTDLEGRIDSLAEALENQGNRSQSKSQNLKQEIKQRDQEIKRLNGLIGSVNQTMDDFNKLLGTAAGDLRTALIDFPQEECDIITSFDRVRVVLNENLVFKGTSATRMTTRGNEVLEIISNVMQRYPNLVIQVTGHTDNRKPANKGYKDNWNYSVLRAASVSRQLIQEYDMTPNQITAAGKSEFEPIASNEDEAGRIKNRRMELVITPLIKDLARSVEKILKSEDPE